MRLIYITLSLIISIFCNANDITIKKVLDSKNQEIEILESINLIDPKDGVIYKEGGRGDRVYHEKNGTRSHYSYANGWIAQAYAVKIKNYNDQIENHLVISIAFMQEIANRGHYTPLQVESYYFKLCDANNLNPCTKENGKISYTLHYYGGLISNQSIPNNPRFMGLDSFSGKNNLLLSKLTMNSNDKLLFEIEEGINLKDQDRGRESGSRSSWITAPTEDSSFYYSESLPYGGLKEHVKNSAHFDDLFPEGLDYLLSKATKQLR